MENQEPEEADYAWLLAKAKSVGLSLVEYLKSNQVTYDRYRSIIDEFDGNSTGFTDHVNSTNEVKGYKSKKARRLLMSQNNNNVNNGATNNNIGLNISPHNQQPQQQQHYQSIHQQRTFQNTSSSGAPIAMQFGVGIGGGHQFNPPPHGVGITNQTTVPTRYADPMQYLHQNQYGFGVGITQQQSFFATQNDTNNPHHLAMLSSGMNDLSIAASSNDGPPLPPLCEYVEVVTVKRVVQGSVIVLL